MSTGPALDARFAVSHPQLLSRDIKLLRSFSPPPFGGRRQRKFQLPRDLFSRSLELISFLLCSKVCPCFVLRGSLLSTNVVRRVVGFRFSATTEIFLLSKVSEQLPGPKQHSIQWYWGLFSSYSDHPPHTSAGMKKRVEL